MSKHQKIFNVGELPATEDEKKYQRVGSFLVTNSCLLQFLEEKDGIARINAKHCKNNDITELKRLTKKLNIKCKEIDDLKTEII